GTFVDVGHSGLRRISDRSAAAKRRSGELIPVVARDEQREVIGHLALERESGAVVAERGEAVVLAAYRGHHLLERMTERLSEEACKQGLVGIYAEPLTIHTFSQRNDERAGMPVWRCAARCQSREFPTQRCSLPDCRTATELSSHLPVRAAPVTGVIYAPAKYRDILPRIYANLGVTASFASPSAVLPKNRGPVSRSMIVAMV